MIEKGIEALADVSTNGSPKAGKMAAVKKALITIEDGTVDDMVRVGKEILKTHKNCKLIIALNYINNIVKAKRAFEDAGYEPLTIYSEKKAAKAETVALFQEDNKYNILLMTTSSGGTSVDLHDIYGGRKRFLLISPDYNMTNVHQTTGRIFRVGNQTVGEAYIFYAKGAGLASQIINSLSAKSAFMNKTLQAGKIDKEPGKLPGQYDRYVEDLGHLIDKPSFLEDDTGEIDDKERWIIEDDKKGRKRYYNNVKFIGYVQECLDENTEIVGNLVFRDPYPDNEDAGFSPPEYEVPISKKAAKKKIAEEEYKTILEDIKRKRIEKQEQEGQLSESD